MTLETLWALVLVWLVAGYLVLDGYDYGIGMLLPALGRDDRRRRLMLNATGPFLLGNEVWLVAVAGVMIAAFPGLEGALFTAYYPLIAALLAGLMLRGTGIQLRRFGRGPGWRTAMDAATVTGSLVPAAALGMLVGGMLRGAPQGLSAGAAAADLLHPFTLLCGLAGVLLFSLHGAVYLALRLGGPAGDQARAAVGRLAPAALAVVVAAAAAGALSGDVRAVLTAPVSAAVGAAIAVGACAAAWALARSGAAAAAFACTSVAVLAPFAAVLAGARPHVFTGRAGEGALTLSDVLADEATLALLAWFIVPLAVVGLAAQAWNWWSFRERLDERSPLYF
ncbi:cytochrome d ubiquinol oxidase subunit II [Nocardiopsis sp. RSe5-2]|uniref:Cytochrome d ubiquinol oxidase subunit II n=1 Tax=Nocardiopsis endophytica TaxID=3018445 RepID=A0ABT4U7T2_9ACTN|nr:cytochrome d ubiquinol oxidase subunit II [Nocardiopsis endophytica]MDA2813009.1 cytochrome d ubiquinol oxidase subunit II [Nocardiopsis endophytica]